MEDKIIKTFEEVPWDDFEVPTIAVFNHPKDYPNDIIARVFEKGNPTKYVMKSPTWEIIEEKLKKTGMYRIPRGPEDAPVVMEAWI